MEFLREFIKPDSGLISNVLVENTSTADKDIFIKGIYMQADVRNENGRVYPEEYMDREIRKLQQVITEKSLLGELDHPEHPEGSLQNAAFKITSLKKDGTNYLGEGKILKDIPKGLIAYNLAKEGIKFGVSSRAVGSTTLIEGVRHVNSDLNVISVDLVSSPSAPEAWVDSIMESKEYYIENGVIKEDVMGTYYKKIHALPKAQLNEGVTKLFEDFISEI